MLFLSILSPLATAQQRIFWASPTPNTGQTTMGQQIYPAVDMAIEDINNDPTVLPGVVLDRHMYDHQCQNGAGSSSGHRMKTTTTTVTKTTAKGRRVVYCVGVAN